MKVVKHERRSIGVCQAHINYMMDELSKNQLKTNTDRITNLVSHQWEGFANNKFRADGWLAISI